MSTRRTFYPGSAADAGPLFALAVAEVGFGAGVGFEESLVTQFVAAPTVGDTPVVLCMVAGSPLDHGPQDAAVEGINAYVSEVQAGVGFEIAVAAPNGTWGDYTVNCFYIP